MNDMLCTSYLEVKDILWESVRLPVQHSLVDVGATICTSNISKVAVKV